MRLSVSWPRNSPRQAALALPIGFVEQSGFFVPVMLTSPILGRNAAIGPNGEWFVGYTPAVLRAYPLLVAPSKGAEPVLCINEDSGLVVPADDNTEKFFNADGSYSEPVAKILTLLRHIDENRIFTNQAVVALSDAGVIKRWNLVVPVGNREVPVNGFYSVDEAALEALDDAGYVGLRRAMGVAYAQLVSTGQVGLLSRLARVQETSLQVADAVAKSARPTQ